jgi:preprotein translocase subunit SecG
MGEPEEISNIEQFPLAPRVDPVIPPAQVSPSSSAETAEKKRSLTPTNKGQVDFWNHGERPLKSIASKIGNKGSTHAKTADQLGLVMIILATLLLVLTVVVLYLTEKKYDFEKAAKHNSRSPEINFYSGNNVFFKKFHAEKEAKQGILESEALVAPEVAVDTQVPLKEQMDSMNEKIEKMRAQKLLEDPPLPPPVAKPRTPSKTIGIMPTDVKKFENPLEFNGLLPKSLQQTNQESH